MDRPIAPKPGSIFNSSAMLVFFQVLGLAIPLLTLPWIARALGVAEFGKVMLSQAIVFFGVVFVDAGFNTESQRRVALAKNPTQNMQGLYDNVVTRSLCALPAVGLILGLGLLFRDVPLLYVLVATLHIAGTLCFPQWWLIGNGMGFQMGLASTLGRLFAAALTLALVRTPDDGLLAVAAASSGTLWSGLLVSPAIRTRWRSVSSDIDRSAWRSYFRVVRPTIVSGFFSSASASTPSVLLGWISGIAQVGYFTAADRLTRAAAHLIGVVEQSLMGPLARAEEADQSHGKKMRGKLLSVLAAITGLGCLIVAYFSPEIVQLIYGDRFLPVASVLRWLCIWLWLFAMRRAILLFTLSLRGDLKRVSHFQWLETACVTGFVACGAFLAGANGAVLGLIACEVALFITLWWVNRTVKGRQ